MKSIIILSIAERRRPNSGHICESFTEGKIDYSIIHGGGKRCLEVGCKSSDRNPYQGMGPRIFQSSRHHLPPP